MNCYYVETQKEGLRTFYTVRCRLDGKEVPAANQFLMHKLRESCSPNTVKRFALSGRKAFDRWFSIWHGI